MKIPIDEITIKEELRIRQELGDTATLENSIRKVGLLNPILVDENYRLIAGHRRLTACRNLGWREIEATIVRFEGDLLKMLAAEVDENLLRKEFTGEEIESIERRREEILHQLRGNIWERLRRWLKSIFRFESKKIRKEDN